ncbi:MAG TPA: hypothetical protein VLT61_00835 [Anaeromyxobacteraceae bacterium]|nr:hypothetical protein [Anaeromyxobacteraceae bacterium]
MGERAPGARLGAERAIGIGLRTAHLAAMALLLGASRFEAPAAALRTWLAATALTGVALVVSESRHSRHWIVQVRGLLVLAHVGAAGLVQLRAGFPALAAALVIGAVGSHLPRSVRKWSIRQRAVVE